MRFPTVFRRQKGSASSDPALGSDSAPTTAPPSAAADNVLFCRLRDVNGWPCHRVAVCWTTTAANPTALDFDAYFWEDATARWYKINDSPLVVKPNQLFFFDTVTILEPSPTTSQIGKPGSPAQAGSMEVAIVATDPGAQVNGVFAIAVGPDMTPVGT